MQNYIKLAKDRVEAGKSLQLVKNAIRKYYLQQTELVDRECPECNPLDGMDNDCNTCDGSGVIQVSEPKTYTEEELTTLVDTHSIVMEYTNQLGKAEKAKALDELVISSNSVAYDANGKAIGNMSAVVAVANFKFNKALAGGFSTEEAYKTIYKDSKIGWKNANNGISYVQVESIAEALEKSMYSVAKVIGVL